MPLRYQIISILFSFFLVGCTSKSSNMIDQAFIHKYGVEASSDDRTSLGQDGQVVTRLKSGVVMKKTFSSGVLEGDTIYTFPHSDTVECIETYSHDHLIRKITHYFCGTPREETLYHLDGGYRITTWFENGTPRSIEEYEGGRLQYGEYYNPSNKLESQVRNGQGVRVKRDEFGELTSSETMEKGKVVLRTTHYSNGSPKEMTPFNADGIVEGERKTFLQAGEPRTVEKWVGGVQHGTTLVFQNGEKYAEVPYVKGAKKGVERRFRSGKVVCEEITWYDDVRHGPSYTYIGDSVKTDYYFQGKEVSRGQYEMLMNPTER